MSGNDDDDDNNINLHVYRESNDIKQNYVTRHLHHNLLFNLGYQLNNKEEQHYPLASSSWIVCMWYVVSTLDLVWKDMINEAAEMKLYHRHEGHEIYHITLPKKQSRDWVSKKIFIPEQIVWAYPAEHFNNELILPSQMVDQISSVQRANSNRLLWHHLIYKTESTYHEQQNQNTSSTDSLLGKATTVYPFPKTDSE